MRIKVSPNGRIVLPVRLRRILDIKRGDLLEAKLENGRIILIPQKKRGRKIKIRIVIDPATGLPCLTAGPDAPILTSKEVRELLG